MMQERERLWPRPQFIVVIVFSGKKSVKHMLLAMQEEIEQCVVIMFLDELSSRWSVGRIQTNPDSSTNDSFNAIPIICRREGEAPPGTGSVQQFGEDDGCVDSLQGQVVHAMAA